MVGLGSWPAASVVTPCPANGMQARLVNQNWTRRDLGRVGEIQKRTQGDCQQKHTFAASGTVRFRCKSPSAGAFWTLSDASIASIEFPASLGD